jgi:drug/metabolite transporter (DMT)-like permease
MIGLPKASLPDPAMAAWLPIALVGPACYAAEANIVARWGTAGLDPVQAMFAASAVGALMAFPLMIGAGHWISPLPPYGKAELALIGSSTIHAILYATYVWLAARTGAVFASQTSYIVTAAGLGWAMLLLGERFSPWIWAAVPVMFAGLLLVRPRWAPQLQLDRA